MEEKTELTRSQMKDHNINSSGKRPEYDEVKAKEFNEKMLEIREQIQKDSKISNEVLSSVISI